MRCLLHIHRYQACSLRIYVFYRVLCFHKIRTHQHALVHECRRFALTVRNRGLRRVFNALAANAARARRFRASTLRVEASRRRRVWRSGLRTWARAVQVSRVLVLFRRRQLLKRSVGRWRAVATSAQRLSASLARAAQHSTKRFCLSAIRCWARRVREERVRTDTSICLNACSCRRVCFVCVCELSLRAVTLRRPPVFALAPPHCSSLAPLSVVGGSMWSKGGWLTAETVAHACFACDRCSLGGWPGARTPGLSAKNVCASVGYK